MISAYLGVLLLSLGGPLLLSFYPPLRFWGKTRLLIRTLLLVAIPFIIWDILATHFGHWSFAPDKVYALRFINLPLEEVLFFFIIPFCCLFTWEVIQLCTRS